MIGKILLTGSTGFVGRHVLNALEKLEVQVRLVVRGKNDSYKILHENVESVVYTQDLFSEDAEWWTDVCKDIDVVIHLAWYAEPGKYLESTKNLDCLIGTLKLAKGAANSKVRRFIGIGTCFEYDLTGGILSIDSPLNPLTPYAGAKVAAFMALSQILAQQKIDFVWCRLFYLFGEGEDSRRLVPYLHSRLQAGQPVELTSGEQIRDYLNVSEAGRLIAEASVANIKGPINICSGVPISIKTIAEQIADEYGRRDLLRFGDRKLNTTDPICVIGVRSENKY